MIELLKDKFVYCCVDSTILEEYFSKDKLLFSFDKRHSVPSGGFNSG